jgi:hypothetical protein
MPRTAGRLAAERVDIDGLTLDVAVPAGGRNVDVSTTLNCDISALDRDVS